jgi:hypothetical protein
MTIGSAASFHASTVFSANAVVANMPIDPMTWVHQPMPPEVAAQTHAPKSPGLHDRGKDPRVACRVSSLVLPPHRCTGNVGTRLLRRPENPPPAD